MAGKITELTAILASAITAADDVVEIVDLTGPTSKKITVAELAKAIYYALRSGLFCPTFGATNFYTIASGTITVSGGNCIVDTEGAAATDDLTTINVTGELAAGDIIVLKAANSARSVVLKNSANIKCGADITLDNEADRVTLIYEGLGVWACIAYYNNGA